MFGCEIAGCEINGLLKDGYSMGPIRVGDIIWVRETWAAVDWCDKSKPSDFGSAVWYQATNSGPHAAAAIPYKTDKRGKWRPSIHMPRWASRIDLEVTAVRLERVQDIDKNGSIAEGIERVRAGVHEAWKNYLFKGEPKKGQEITDKEHRIVGFESPCASFSSLWQSIYSNWDENPFVWAYEFRRVK
jgi:hypothetical protein